VVPNPTNEGQVIQNSVDGATGFLDQTTEGAVKNGTNLVDGVVGVAEFAAEGAVKGTLSGGANFTDSFAGATGSNVNQFVAGTISVIEYKANAAIHKYVGEAIQALEKLPVIGPLLAGVADQAEALVEAEVKTALQSAGDYAEKELSKFTSDQEGKLHGITSGFVQKLEKEFDDALTSQLEPLKAKLEAGIAQAGSSVESHGNDFISNTGAAATNLLGSWAK
jgi:hypothetical protein